MRVYGLGIFLQFWAFIFTATLITLFLLYSNSLNHSLQLSIQFFSIKTINIKMGKALCSMNILKIKVNHLMVRNASGDRNMAQYQKLSYCSYKWSVRQT